MEEPPDTATGGRGFGLTTGDANWCEAAAVRAAIEFMAAVSPRSGPPPMRLPGILAGADPHTTSGGCPYLVHQAAAAWTGRPTGASSPGRSTTISPGARCSSHATSAAVKPATPSGAAATTIWS